MDINAKLNEWEMAGTDTFASAYQSAPIGADDAAFAAFAQQFAQKQTDTVIGPALFGSNYLSKTDLQAAIANSTSVNEASLVYNYTSGGMYKRSQTYDGLQSASKDGLTRTLKIEITEVDNASDIPKVAASYASQGIAIPNGHKEIMTVVTTPIADGKTEIITGLSFTPAN